MVHPSPLAYTQRLFDKDLPIIKPNWLDSGSSVLWRDFELNTKIYPEFENQLLWIMRGFLWYDPQPCDFMPHAAFIRTAINNFRNGLINEKQFFDEVYSHCVHIRNDEMKRKGINKTRYDDHDLEKYETIFPEQKQNARERIIRYWKQEIPFEWSLYSEILSRIVCHTEGVDAPWEQLDHEAASVLSYLRAFLLEGQSVADQSPLVPVLHYIKN